MIITISGPPGSGKTTIARLLAREHNRPLISSGQIFRRMARERGMSLKDFGVQASLDHSIDTKLDEEVLAMVEEHTKKGNDLVVEGRLSGHMLLRKGIDSFKVWVDAPLVVRAMRVAGRENKSLAETKKEIEERERIERKRYEEIYGIDMGDLSIYDMIIDSSDKKPKEILLSILSRVNE